MFWFHQIQNWSLWIFEERKSTITKQFGQIIESLPAEKNRTDSLSMVNKIVAFVLPFLTDVNEGSNMVNSDDNDDYSDSEEDENNDDDDDEVEEDEEEGDGDGDGNENRRRRRLRWWK